MFGHDTNRNHPRDGARDTSTKGVRVLAVCAFRYIVTRVLRRGITKCICDRPKRLMAAVGRVNCGENTKIEFLVVAMGVVICM